MDFKIYKEDEVVAVGSGSLVIEGLLPDTAVKDGEYQVVRVNDNKTESKRVDIPSFTTLGIEEAGLTLSPKTSRADSGNSGSRDLTVITDSTIENYDDVTFTIEKAIGLSVSQLGKIEWTKDTPAGKYTTDVVTYDGIKVGKHTLSLRSVVNP